MEPVYDEFVMNLTPEGTIECLWTDLIDLPALGHCRVERASSVEFNNETQLWEVMLADGTWVGAYPSRAQAIREEVKYLQDRM